MLYQLSYSRLATMLAEGGHPLEDGSAPAAAQKGG